MRNEALFRKFTAFASACAAAMLTSAMPKRNETCQTADTKPVRNVVKQAKPAVSRTEKLRRAVRKGFSAMGKCIIMFFISLTKETEVLPTDSELPAETGKRIRNIERYVFKTLSCHSPLSLSAGLSVGRYMISAADYA